MTYLSQTLRTPSLAALPVMSALPAQAGATSISEILYREIAFPKAPTIELTLRSEPAHSIWDRYLTFEDHTGDRARLKVRSSTPQIGATTITTAADDSSALAMARSTRRSPVTSSRDGAVPDDRLLLGATLYQQALVIDAAAGNALGAVVTIAARLTVGM